MIKEKKTVNSTGVFGESLSDVWKTAKATKSLYTSEEVPKKNGGVRIIDKPKYKLKRLQKLINEKILRKYVLPKTMCGAVFGRSIVDNVNRHRDKKCVITIDIRDFYPSIKYPQILKIFEEELGFDRSSAELLTKLSTYKYRLPQGAPTSAMLSNIYILEAHKEIVAIAKSKGLSVTFFVDDIAISGENPRVIIDDVAKTLNKYGLKLKQAKKKIMEKKLRRVVTGIEIGKQLRVTKEKMLEFRTEIEEALKEGDLKHIRNLVSGIVGFVGMINKKQSDEILQYTKSLLKAPTS